MMTLIKTLFLVSILGPLGSDGTLDKVQTSAIISCLKAKADETGSPLLTSDHGEIKFRYHVGRFAFHYPTGQAVEVGRDDEVRIGVYSQDEKSVVIYNVFISGPPKTPVVEIASPATFHKHSGKWITGDNPGGIAMNLYLLSLLDAFAKQKTNVISTKNVEEVSFANCAVLHP